MVAELRRQTGHGRLSRHLYYRDIYVERLTVFLGRENVAYARFGDWVLVQLLPWLDGNELWGQGAIIMNAERKLAELLSEDQTFDGIPYPAPEEVKRLKKELEPVIGPDPRHRPDGSWVYGSDTRGRAQLPAVPRRDPRARTLTGQRCPAVSGLHAAWLRSSRGFWRSGSRATAASTSWSCTNAAGRCPSSGISGAIGPSVRIRPNAVRSAFSGCAIASETAVAS